MRGVVGRAVVSAGWWWVCSECRWAWRPPGPGRRVRRCWRSSGLSMRMVWVSVSVRRRGPAGQERGGRPRGLTVSASVGASPTAGEHLYDTSLGPGKSCAVISGSASVAVGRGLRDVGRGRQESGRVRESRPQRRRQGLGAGPTTSTSPSRTGDQRRHVSASSTPANFVSLLSHPNQNKPGPVAVEGEYLYWADMGLGTKINKVAVVRRG